MNIIKKFKHWLDAIHNYDTLSKSYKDSLNRSMQDKVKLEDKVFQIKELQETAKAHLKLAHYWVKGDDVTDAEYWNNKWVQHPVWYRAPDKKRVIDYVKYKKILLIDDIADTLIREHNLSVDNVDVVPLTVLKWLESEFEAHRFKYKLDNGEIWSGPEEVLERKYGDCDDWGILEYYIIREIFKQLECWEVVKHRLKAVAGNVNSPGIIPSVRGGHFYLLWLHSDKEWYTIESTYYRYMAIANWGKKPQKVNPIYGVIWFSFNSEYSWSQHSITVSKEDFKKK